MSSSLDSGLLYLPLSPIYGIGGVALTLFLFPYIQQPILMFLVGMAVGTVLEYVASWVMEKLFGTMFWDYSDKPLNIHGRVCLEYSIYWGLLSLLVLYILEPIRARLREPVLARSGEVVVTVLSVLTVCLSGADAGVLRPDPSPGERAAAHGARRAGVADAESGWDRLIERLAPDPVMINTFPRMSLMTDYMDLTGQQRVWIRVRGQLGRPSEVHRKHGGRNRPTPASLRS